MPNEKVRLDYKNLIPTCTFWALFLTMMINPIEMEVAICISVPKTSSTGQSKIECVLILLVFLSINFLICPPMHYYSIY